MKNKFTYIIAGIVFILLNVISFAVPTEKNPSFWTAYAFTVVAFGTAGYTWYISIEKKKELKSKLLGSSVVYISIVYLVIQIIAFFVFMFVQKAPVWIAVIVCALIMGISIICMISADTGADMVTTVEKKVAVKRQYIKDLLIEAEMLAETESDPEIKSMLTGLAKKIRLSDPMSDDSLSSLEAELSEKLAEIENSSCKAEVIEEAEMLLLKRNKKVKALKG